MAQLPASTQVPANGPRTRALVAAVALAVIASNCAGAASQADAITCSVCAGFEDVVDVVSCTGDIVTCIGQKGGCALPPPVGQTETVNLISTGWSATDGATGSYTVSKGDGTGSSLDVIQLSDSSGSAGAIDIVAQCPAAYSTAANTCHLCATGNAVACTTTLQACIDAGNGTCSVSTPAYTSVGTSLLPTGAYMTYFALTASTGTCSFASGTYNIPCTYTDTSIDATRTDQPPATQALDFQVVLICS